MAAKTLPTQKRSPYGMLASKSATNRENKQDMAQQLAQKGAQERRCVSAGLVREQWYQSRRKPFLL